MQLDSDLKEVSLAWDEEDDLEAMMDNIEDQTCSSDGDEDWEEVERTPSYGDGQAIGRYGSWVVTTLGMHNSSCGHYVWATDLLDGSLKWYWDGSLIETESRDADLFRVTLEAAASYHCHLTVFGGSEF